MKTRTGLALAIMMAMALGHVMAALHPMRSLVDPICHCLAREFGKIVTV